MALGWVLGLTADEAHYALYAAHPALSYYDHPPLVGWIQWPLVVLHAPDGLLRLIPQLLWVATALLVFELARRFHERLSCQSAGSEASGLWAVAAFSVSPVLHLLGIALLPDTLLMTLTAATLLQTSRLMRPERALRWRDWFLLAVLLGLCGLSKYTAVFVAVPVVMCLVTVHGWRFLASPAPWLAVLLAIAIVSPVFIWNAQHEWRSLAYQLHHGGGSHWQFTQMGMFALAQLLMYPALIWGVLGLWRAQGQWTLAAMSLLGFFALPFGVLMYLSGGGSGLPHWTAPAWVALTPFAGVGLAVLWAQGRRWVTGFLLTVQALVCVLIYALMLNAGLPGMQASEQPEAINPFTDFYGWDAAASTAQRLARANQLTHLAVQNWTLASRLAWYARPLSVHVLEPDFSQFSLWDGPLEIGADALLIDWSQMAYKLPVGADQFTSCTPLEQNAVSRGGRTVATFAFYVCQHWGGVAQPRRWDEP